MNWPLSNAILNGTSAVLLVSGLIAIKAGRRHLHERLMQLATIVSALVLAVLRSLPGPVFFPVRLLGAIYSDIFINLADRFSLKAQNASPPIKVNIEPAAFTHP